MVLTLVFFPREKKKRVNHSCFAIYWCCSFCLNVQYETWMTNRLYFVLRSWVVKFLSESCPPKYDWSWFWIEINQCLVSKLGHSKAALFSYPLYGKLRQKLIQESYQFVNWFQKEWSNLSSHRKAYQLNRQIFLNTNLFLGGNECKLRLTLVKEIKVPIWQVANCQWLLGLFLKPCF